MANRTIYTYDLDGAERDFLIPFEYLSRKFVVVTLMGTERQQLILNSDYRFTQRTVITTSKAWGPADGFTRIEIKRVTSATERLVDFSDGSVLRAYDLNTSQVQALHIAEEGRDIATDTIGVDANGNLDARGRRVVNLAYAVDPDDAVSLGQVRSWDNSALNSALRAERAAVASEGSAVKAAASEVKSLDAAIRAANSAAAAETWGVHSLRTPLSEAPLRELPQASLRANSLIAFDINGDVVLAGPSSGSAQDLALQLANPDGVKLVGNAMDIRDMGNLEVLMKFANLPIVVDTVAEARTLSTTKGARLVQTRGYYAPYDGGRGTYHVVPGGTGVDDGGFTLRTPDGTLVLEHGGRANLRQWGCKGDNVTDDTARFMAACATGFPVWAPKGRYRVSPIGPVNQYPGGREPNRTTGNWLTTGQSVTGEGQELSVFIWNNATNQCFFGVKAATDVRISNVGFDGGYSPLIVTATVDDGVKNVGMYRCKSVRALQGFIAGLQVVLDQDGSKRSRDLYAIECNFEDNVTSHAIMFSNVMGFRAINNNFRRNSKGYAIDMSHGSKSGLVYGNTADGGLYFCKVESSKQVLVGEPTTDPEKFIGRDIVISHNVTRNITGQQVFLNSMHERVIVIGNDFEGGSDVSVETGSVTGEPSEGQLIIANNIIRMTGSNSIGIRLRLNTSSLPVMIMGNRINAAFGIRGQQSRWFVVDNVLDCTNSGFVPDQPSNRIVTTSTIARNHFKGPTGINCQVSTLPYRMWGITDNMFDCDTPIYGAEVAGWQFLTVRNNRCHSRARSAIPGMSFRNVTDSQLCGNTMNQASSLPGATLYSIRIFGETVRSIIRENTCTRIMEIQGRDSVTTEMLGLNITSAEYVDSTN